MSIIKPRSVSKVIYQGDDIARLSELYRAAESARQFAVAGVEDARAGDDEPSVARQRQDEYDAFVDEAAERAVTVTLQAIGRRRFRDLMAAHPPRVVDVPGEPTTDADGAEVPGPVRQVTHEDDADYEVNTETFPDALLTYVDPDSPAVRTVASPDFADSAAVAAFLDDEIADGDYDELWVTAYHLNRLPSADPKASRFSPESRSSGEI